MESHGFAIIQNAIINTEYIYGELSKKYIHGEPMKKLFLFLSLIVLLVFSHPVFAVEDTATPPANTQTVDDFETPSIATRLEIDVKNVYPDMDKSYSQGYMPTVKNNQAIVVLPLMLERGSIRGDILAAVNLGDPSSAPFEFLNYKNTFSMQSYQLSEMVTTQCYLVKFVLSLNKTRYMGRYPVNITVEYTDDLGAAYSQVFEIYVTIKDGKDPNAVIEIPPPTPEPPPVILSQPKVIISQYLVDKDAIYAGGAYKVTVSLLNTSKEQAINNIKIKYQPEDINIVSTDNRNTYYYQSLDKNSVLNFDVLITVLPNTMIGMQKINFIIEYEDKDKVQIMATEDILLKVQQTVRLEHGQPSLPKTCYEGDNLNFTLNLMNMGKGMINNLLLSFDIPGVKSAGSVLVGNIGPGESTVGQTNLLVSSMDGAYGESNGKVKIQYEDEYGAVYDEILDVSFTISAPVPKETAAAPESDTKTKENAAVWVWVVVGCVVVAALVGGVMVALNRRRARKYDEDTL